MKKIGILNFQYSTHNYGAVLQAAALEHICTQLGHEARHLDYMAKPRVTFKGRVGQALRKLGLRKTPSHTRVANEEAFERFREKFITRTTKIRTPSEFRSVANEFDAVIVGSDQVWRPAYSNGTTDFFLGLVPPGVDRVAYAASFGTSSWEEENKPYTDKVREELQKFKAVSCREDSGVEICQKIFNLKAEHVLDPLLLVDDAFFDKILTHSTSELKGVLGYYKLDYSPEFERDVEVLNAEYGTTSLNLYSSDSKSRVYREVSDWLGFIMSSEVVVTDSFHCICLGVRFGKKVIYCPNPKRGQARLESLFHMLGIDVKPLSMQLESPMYELSSRGGLTDTLKKKRMHSLRFLNNALLK